MSVTDNERTEIFSRIGQLEGARVNEASHIQDHSSKPTTNGSGAKAFASILVIVSIIGGLSAIVRPMQQQVDFLSSKIDKLQEHVIDGHPERVDAKVNAVQKMVENHVNVATQYITQINELEKQVAVLKQQMVDGTQDRYYARDARRDKELLETKIDNLEQELKELKELKGVTKQ